VKAWKRLEGRERESRKRERDETQRESKRGANKNTSIEMLGRNGKIISD